MGESTHLRDALKDPDTATSNVAYWTNVESLFLGTMTNANVNKITPLESDLIKLYIEILKFEVELVGWASNRGIGMTLC